MKLARRDLQLSAWKQTLLIDDPRTWRIWRHVAWLLPLGVGMVVRVVWLMWRNGEIR